jgi:DNA-binding response OmpR family regulator
MKKILVVDDDPAILEVIQIILEDNNYLVNTSLSGKIFNDLEDTPDLILLDVLLSGEDGRDIAKKLKNNKNTKNIPIIMISAHPSARESVRNMDAVDFISKPFDIDKLLEIVDKNLSEVSHPKTSIV